MSHETQVQEQYAAPVISRTSDPALPGRRGPGHRGRRRAAAGAAACALLAGGVGVAMTLGPDQLADGGEPGSAAPAVTDPADAVGAPYAAIHSHAGGEDGSLASWASSRNDWSGFSVT